MLKTHLAWLLNVLVFTTSIQKKADLVVLQILLLPSSVMLFLLLIFPLFCKGSIRSQIGQSFSFVYSNCLLDIFLPRNICSRKKIQLLILMFWPFGYYFITCQDILIQHEDKFGGHKVRVQGCFKIIVCFFIYTIVSKNGIF